MLYLFSRGIVLLSLAGVLLVPVCEASSLGMSVHVVPLESEGDDRGKMVKAHFTAIASNPCPSLSGLCDADDQDCEVHATSFPFEGSEPSPGWCVRQWLKKVPSNYTSTISLGSDTEFYVSLNAGPHVRSNNGHLNHPPFVALPPPLRARTNCPHHYHLSVKDLDGDRVRCRFAREDEGECVGCALHPFIELEEDKCMMTFTGAAPAGRYSVYLMAEDLIPMPKVSQTTKNNPMSAVPVHLSITVLESSASCSDEPMASGETPAEDTTLYILPYHQEKFNAIYQSAEESISEIAVVGPPGLFKVDFESVSSMASITMAWVRSQNKLPRALPICFLANTKSLQSEPRCVWLYQKEMGALPEGTELTCDKTLMTLVLPIGSLNNINLDNLELNSPSCPVSYNDTHLTAEISLTGCGTKVVHSGSELVYTNVLQSVHPNTIISRLPSFVLPLACRIPVTKVKGPEFGIRVPTEKELFGGLSFDIRFYYPGEGPFSDFTRNPILRSVPFSPRAKRDTDPFGVGPVGSKLSHLDLYLMSNCTVKESKMIVGSCMESETEDFLESYPILEDGCSSSREIEEIVTDQSNSKVYRLDMSSMNTKGTTMYVKCNVNLCISTIPSETCPDLCDRKVDSRVLQNTLKSETRTLLSGPVSLVVTPPPISTNPTSPIPPTVATPDPTSAAPGRSWVVTVAVMLPTVLLQLFFLH